MKKLVWKIFDKICNYYLKISIVVGSILGTCLVITSLIGKTFRIELLIFTVLCYGSTYYYYKQKKITKKYESKEDEYEEDDDNDDDELI